MSKSFYFVLLISLLSCLLQSCKGTMYPNFRTYPLGTRMIQPIPQNGNINALPQKSNFVQSYPRYKKSIANSTNFAALVRIIEFGYDITDTVTLIARITSGYDEGQMTGLITIILDKYELTYENNSPQIREYVEEVSYESENPRQQTQQIYAPYRTDVAVSPNGQHSTQVLPSSISTIQDSKKEKQMQVINRSQLYNTAKYNLEAEDVKLLLNSKTLSYIIHLQNANLSVYPSNEQIGILKKMIKQHYSPNPTN